LYLLVQGAPVTPLLLGGYLPGLICGDHHPVLLVVPAAAAHQASAASRTSTQSCSGSLARFSAPLMPWVPVLAPRGAASWHGSPRLHIGRPRQFVFVQMSVGFMRLSPYWQSVTVSRRCPWTTRIFLAMPRGFSTNHAVGFSSSMSQNVRSSSARESSAVFDFGM